MSHDPRFNPDPVDMSGTAAHLTLRRYYEAHPPRPRPQRRVSPADNVLRAIQARNAERALDYKARAERGYALYQDGLSLDAVAQAVGMSARKLRQRWIAAGYTL